MLLDEVRGLNEHAARSTGRIEHLSAVRLYDLDHQAHHAARREELATFVSFTASKLTEEIFVNLSQQITASIRWDIGEVFQQIVWDSSSFWVARQFEILILRQNAFQLRFVFLNVLHRLLQRFGDVFALRQVQQIIIASMIGQVEPTLLYCNIEQLLFAPSTF